MPGSVVRIVTRGVIEEKHQGRLDPAGEGAVPEDAFCRMPAHFGPSFGPRNSPDSVVFDHERFPISTRLGIHFLTDRQMLEALLPAGLELVGDPIATLEFVTLKRIAWLAGRDYNTLSFSFPVRFRGKRDNVVALFRAVIFESLPDAVITGREELGISKLWAELPDPVQNGDRLEYSAVWGGFEFAKIWFEQSGTRKTVSQPKGSVPTEGILNYKYIPRTGEFGVADVSYFTFWPHYTASGMTVENVQEGRGGFSFNTATWEQLPTLCTVINRLAGLPVKDVLLSELVHARGQGSIRNAIILE